MTGALLLAMSCGDDAGNGETADTEDAGTRDAATSTTPEAGSNPDVDVDASSPGKDAGDAGASEPHEDSGAPGEEAGTSDDTGPIAGGIVLDTATNAQAAAVANLVGVYTGTLGIWAPNDSKPARYTDNCTITVSADGTLAVSASDNELHATMNGNDLDVVTSPNRDALSRNADAYDVITNGINAVTVRVLRGFVTSATAAHRTLESVPINTVTCYVRNPNPRNVRKGSGTSGTDLQYGGATGADLDSEWIGTYGNGSCTVTIGADGTLHLTKGAVDISARMAGDADSEFGDAQEVFPSSTELFAGEHLLDGRTQSVRLRNTGSGWSGFARDTADILVEYADCKDLSKK